MKQVINIVVVAMLAIASAGCFGGITNGLAVDTRFNEPVDSVEFAAACQDREKFVDGYKRTSVMLTAGKTMAAGLAMTGLAPLAAVSDAMFATKVLEGVASGIPRQEINEKCAGLR